MILPFDIAKCSNGAFMKYFTLYSTLLFLINTREFLKFSFDISNCTFLPRVTFTENGKTLETFSGEGVGE